MGSIPSSYKDICLVCTFEDIFNLLFEKRYTEIKKRSKIIRHIGN